jgi:hypothetical protein
MDPVGMGIHPLAGVQVRHIMVTPMILVVKRSPAGFQKRHPTIHGMSALSVTAIVSNHRSLFSQVFWEII